MKGAGNADLPDKCRLTCKLPTCGDAIADAAETCDGVDLKNATCASLSPGATGQLGCADDCQAYAQNNCTKPLTKIVIAALNVPSNGNLGGLTGADAKCAADAAAAGRTETFKAFLSVAGGRDVATMIVGANASLQVQNTLNQTLYPSYSGIFDGSNPNFSPPMYTFNGKEVNNSFNSDADGWTGSDVNGKAKETCSGWTSASGQGTATEVDGKNLLKQESHGCGDVLAVMCVSVAP